MLYSLDQQYVVHLQLIGGGVAILVFENFHAPVCFLSRTDVSLRHCRLIN